MDHTWRNNCIEELGTFERPDFLTYRARWDGSRVHHTHLYRETSAFLNILFPDLVQSPAPLSGTSYYPSCDQDLYLTHLPYNKNNKDC